MPEASERIAMPPGPALEPTPAVMVPGSDMATWIKGTFIAEEGRLYNPDHAFLQYATLGVLWTNRSCTKKGRLAGSGASRPRWAWAYG